MSKPNLLGFSTSVGFYRNKRIMDLRGILSKQLPGKVPFADLSPMLFQATMAYAAENQIDGDFSEYTSSDFAAIFVTNNIPVSVSQAAEIRKAFDSVGLMEDGKIRSWAKFNRHFAEHEKIVKAKRRAGKLSREKWLKGLKEAANPAGNGAGEHEKTAPKPVQKPAEKDSISKALWANKELLHTATGKQRKALLSQREQLIGEVTGVAPTPPSSQSPAPSAPPARKKSAEEVERESLTMAKSTLAEFPEALSDHAVTLLVKAGHKLPGPVRSRHRALIAKLESNNPVPE